MEPAVTRRLALGIGGVAACSAFLVWQPKQVEWVVLPLLASLYAAADSLHAMVRRRR